MAQVGVNQTGRRVTGSIKADFLEAGSGPPVMLVPSSVSGARQWRRLIDDLKADFHVRAVNLFGYGRTPPWPMGTPQTLEDQARLVETALPAGHEPICLVGHSFGGAVAMKVAARLSGRVVRLVLLETNPFYLLKQAGRTEAFAEVMELRDCVKSFGARGEWAIAGERFADYWAGAGSWQAMTPERRAAFAEAMKPNFSEWNAVMEETTPIAQLARLLPRETLVASDPDTALPVRALNSLLRQACPHWTYVNFTGGHMAPLTRPDLINPLVRSFLQSQDAAAPAQASA